MRLRVDNVWRNSQFRHPHSMISIKPGANLKYSNAGIERDKASLTACLRLRDMVIG